MDEFRKVLVQYIKGPTKRFIASAMVIDYYVGNYKEVIWLVGDGRSGTTWLSDLINYSKQYREMFEPFHPKLVTGMEEFSFNQYVKPNCTDTGLARTIASVFSGKFRNERVDSRNVRLVFYKGLLIKDIFANLLMGWVARNLPDVKIVLLIRNPFAVALSKLKMSKAIWMREPSGFLKQKELMSDHLESFREILNRDDYGDIEKQILIWAVIHYVPLKQLRKGQVHIVFYEELYANPEQELSRLFAYLYGAEGAFLETKLLEKIRVPSRVSGKLTNIVSGTSPIFSWKEKLSASQIDRGVDILRTFGLEEIYGSEFMPSRSVTDMLITRGTGS